MNGVIFIGLQASGKSSFFKDYFSGSHLCLSMDMLKTRHRERILFDACLRAKQPVVIDNTNPKKEDRVRYTDEFKKHKFQIVGYYFQSSLEECLKRNALRTGKARIPDVGIKGTFNSLESPGYNEGFDELYYVSINDGEFIIKEWNNEI